MPKGKGYKMHIGKGGTRTPKNVQGGQGHSVSGKTINANLSNKSKATKTTKFPE